VDEALNLSVGEDKAVAFVLNDVDRMNGHGRLLIRRCVCGSG
jgi:hypothetical protein